MTTAAPTDPPIRLLTHDETTLHLSAAEAGLNHLTTHGVNHAEIHPDPGPNTNTTTSTDTNNAAALPPDAHPTPHAHASHEHTRKWMSKVFGYSDMDELENAWHLGNYVLDRRTGERGFEEMSIYVRLGMHLLYYGSEQSKVLHYKKTQDLLRKQSVQMGQQYDSPDSTKHIEPFVESFKLRGTLGELKEPDLTKYKNFNEFFARQLKDGARPIAEPTNDLVISSPADCRLGVYPTIDLATKYWIKGFGFTLSKLLASDALAQQFDGGSIAIARLAPQDYHRWHSPVSGKIESITEIPGTYYTVNPQAVTQAGTLDVFSENKRSVMMIRRSGTGSPVAVIAVGAMLVGSIKYNPGIDVGRTVSRGECLGAFLYGGSTVIVLFPKGEVALDADLVRNSTEEVCETLVKVGWQIGVSPGQ